MSLDGLPTESRAAVRDLVDRLASLDGVVAVVLGGSHARGRARPDSDVDLGLLYAEDRPPSIDAIRVLAREVDDSGAPVVTGFYEWGPWVNGGAWLTAKGRRLDLLYRSLEHLERAVADAQAGRYEIHWPQQPPFGFWSGTYLGELAVCVPLFVRDGRLLALKQRVSVYPDALRDAVVRDQLWQVEFGLEAFARKLAARGDVYGVAGCLARFASQLVLALFAHNRTWLVNDKTALAEIEGFAEAPRDFGTRLEALLARPGASAGALTASVQALAQLFRETAVLCAGSRVRSPLP